MASVSITVDGVLWDKALKAGRAVTLVGEAVYTDLVVGLPPMSGNTPAHPIAPGGSPPVVGGGPIYPPEVGGGPIFPPEIGGGPIIPPETPIPPEPPIDTIPPPETEPDEDGFLKSPPEGGGWALHETYGWGFYPSATYPGPKD